MSESVASSSPTIFTSLFICENVLREKNDLLTAVRIASAFNVNAVALSPKLPDGTQDDEKTVIAMPPLKFFAVVIFTCEQPVEFKVEVRTKAPSGRIMTNERQSSIPIKIQGDHFYQILNLELALNDQESGLYWLQVFVNGNLANQIGLQVMRRTPNLESFDENQQGTISAQS